MSTRFRVSETPHGFDNPVMMEELEANHQGLRGTEDAIRRLSLISAYEMGRRSSRDSAAILRVNSNLSLPDSLSATCHDHDGSWVHITHDVIPRVEFYRHSHTLNKYLDRPSLDELRNAKPISRQNGGERRVSFAIAENPEEGVKREGSVKFGWIRGVYIRCLLNIWGVMLFLRMGWMVGQAGIGASILIVLLASAVTVVTTLSMSAICTNGEVRGGGAYYMISRSLGPEFGGAIGWIFFVANSVAVSMYIVGAAETIRDLLLIHDAGIVEYPSSINDVRVSGILLLILVMCVTGVGMAFENKAQIVLLVLLLAALMDYFVGACLTPTLVQQSKGFVGWNAAVGRDNLVADYRDGESFFSVFSIFFPSVIGILAGANISGDLKDPCTAIPKGTLLSIASTSFSYVLIIIWLGLTIVRDATGNVEDVLNGTFTNCTNRPCPHGLSNYNQVMEMSSGFGPLIYIGIFAATLSSALAALVSAPRIFQALCKDMIFKALIIFAKGYGPNNDPRRAAAFTFLISLLCVIIGDLNAIAPIISNLFLGAHCLINFSCFHASYVKSPGFRPGFKYYNKWLSLMGSILCISVMFIMSWITALITFAIVLGLYIYINKTAPDVNWGDSKQGFVYKNALAAVVKLNAVEEHVKNFRPAILVLTGNPSSRPPLVDLAYAITKKLGLTVCGHVVKNNLPNSLRSVMVDHNDKWLAKRKVKAFYSVYEANSLSEGTRSMLELVGLGKMKPNTLMLGFKTKWREAEPEELDDYFNVIHLAFDMRMSVAIMRVEEGLDYTSYFESDTGAPFKHPTAVSPPRHDQTDLVTAQDTTEEPGDENGSDGPEDDNTDPTSNTGDQNHLKVDEEANGVSGMASTAARKLSRDVQATLSKFRRLTSLEGSKFNGGEVPPEVLNAVNQFQKKQSGTIDVWWLYDDGGLTLLIPYLLTTRSKWADCSLRIFCVTSSEFTLDQTQVNITSLLNKFRINFTAVTVIPDLSTPPSKESKEKFDELISKWVREDNEKSPFCITKSDLSLQKDRTNRTIRLKELLELHSKNSSLIVMTLPMPRKHSCPAALYLAWLDTLTANTPPFLLVRGNQTSVLTFYS